MIKYKNTELINSNTIVKERGRLKEKEFTLSIPLTKRRELFKLKVKLEKICDDEKDSAQWMNIYSSKQLYFLKYIVSKNKSFIISSLTKNDERYFDIDLKQTLYDRIFDNENFIRLLVGESLTNRLNKSCKNGYLPIWLIDKIEMCVLAFVIYGKSVNGGKQDV